MKAGILTLQEADNYGAVLQAYALQTALTYIDVESEFIVFEEDVLTRKIDQNETGISPIFLRRLREKAKIRSEHFSDFRRKHLKCAVPISRQEAGELNNKYDLFISGSDQVWNFSIPKVDGRYFLPFASPEKRFSYAASFGGSNVPDRMKDWVIQQLKNFRGISVREEHGRETVKELIGRDSIVCVDPVFLLERARWDGLTHEVMEEKYLLLFLIQYNKEAIAFAENLAEDRKVKVKIVTASYMGACGVSAWTEAGVNDWLSFIKNADCVITDSFHGCAFSLIFGKPFSIVSLKGGLGERNGRIMEILKMTGTEKSMSGELVYLSEHEFMACMDNAVRTSYDYLKAITQN